jgi:hypothetical protein
MEREREKRWAGWRKRERGEGITSPRLSKT